MAQTAAKATKAPAARTSAAAKRRTAEIRDATLATIAGCRPTVASQHLSKLRFAGPVEGHRHGQRVVYRLRGGHVRALLSEALFHADHQISGAPLHD